MRDAYEIYCAWCLSNGKTPPTREFWNDFVSIIEAHREGDDGEEIVEEIRKEAP